MDLTTVPALKFGLRKLPVWGSSYGINFEWPTEEMIKDMPADVFLRSIEFKSTYSDHRISSVSCILSNKQSSPVFQDEEIEHFRKETILLSANSVKSVVARQGKGSCALLSITLMNSDGDQISKY